MARIPRAISILDTGGTARTRAPIGFCNSWAAYCSTRSAAGFSAATYTDYANASAREHAAIVELAGAAHPKTWWYNYLSSPRARINVADLPTGNTGFTTNPPTLDTGWAHPISGIEFVPMLLRSWASETEWGWLDTECSGATAVMGPVEPDVSGVGVADSVNNVLGIWPRLMTVASSHGWRIGAPCVAQDHSADYAGQWFEQWWDLAQSNGYTVDFIPLHYFGLYSNTTLPSLGASTMDASLRQLRNYIIRVYEKYQKPIWQETALIQSVDNTLTGSMQADWIEGVAYVMGQLGTEVVERFSYWPLGPNPYTEDSAAAYDTSGAITSFGTRFKAL